MDIEIDVCMSCGASMTRGHFKECPSCGGEHLIAQEAFEKAKENVEYHFPNNHPDKYTEELKEKICAEAKAKQEQSAEEALAAKHREHPVDEFGELDMSSELNNPIIPDSPIKPTADESEEPDMSQPENNPYIPGSSAPENFGKEEEEVDMTLPENNPYIPQGKEV